MQACLTFDVNACLRLAKDSQRKGLYTCHYSFISSIWSDDDH
jgi:hypothetical protein